MTTSSTERPAEPARVRGLRVALVLLLVALVPLSGLGALTLGRIQDARALSDTARRTTEVADNAVVLIEIDGAVFDEMVWAAIAHVADELAAPPGVLTAFMGGDPAEGLAAAQLVTDELVANDRLAAAHRASLVQALAATRTADTGLAGVLADYRSIMTTIKEDLVAGLDEITVSTSGSEVTDQLLDSVRALSYASDARTAVADEFYGYFAAVFDLRDAPAVELARLIQERATWDESVAALTESAGAGDDLRAGIAQVQSDPALAALNSAIDGLIATSWAQGVPAQAPTLSLDTVLKNLDGFIAVYQAASDSSAATSALLQAAAHDMLDAANAVQRHADDNIDRTYGLALLVTATTLVAALLAARFIVHPLRELRRAAHGLQDTAEPIDVPIVGPLEVRAAATAIQDAATHLDLVTRQVRALALGSLDAGVLDESAPGGLGTAVQSAVGTLRSALAQQDQFQRRLAHEASHDGLTKLPNRNASMAQLARSLARTTRAGSQLAVLFIDLDRFKDVNDHHGHQAGDTVLTTVAQRLVNHVREGDHVGRLGGDEFVVIAEPVAGVDEAVMLAERLIERLSMPIRVGSVWVEVGASIGIALSDGSDLTPDELLRDADLAVYRAKSTGRGGYEVCDEDLRSELAETADMSVAIRRAIDGDELVLHYQPIVDTHTGALRAFEALVRWQRPGHDGLVPPDKFIGFAERSNLIIDLDCWVVTAVARQIEQWHADHRFSDIPVAVNVSPRHLAHDQFVDHVLAPLAARGIDPRSIIVEVTENALLDDLDGAAIKLQQLRNAGVLVSIDDFGTGYTSLAHLRSLPVDILKIDRSFTTNASADAHEASIVKLIIDTGHLLGVTITAEGVETALEANALTDLGSDTLQGFFFARPQTPEQLTIDLVDRLAAMRDDASPNA